MMSQAGSIARPRRGSATPGTGVLLDRGFDAAWAGVAVATVLLSLALGSISALVLLSLAPLYFLVRHRRVPRLLAVTAPLLALPLLAIASALWSLDPGSTGYYGMQYLVTVMIGAALGAGTDRRQVLRGMFVAFALAAFANAGLGRSVHWGGGGTAFAGLTGSKNAAADMAAVGTMVSCAMLIAAARARQLPWAAAALIVIAVDLWILHSAQSTGSLVACILAVAVMAAWHLSRVLSPQARTALLLAMGITVMAAALLQRLWLEPLMQTLLEATGKDPGLTGRTYIWGRAADLIAQRPMLGLGYNAFWRHGNLDAEAIWAFGGIKSRTGFNFHNTMLEILVHLGAVGLLLFALVALGYAALLVARTVRAPDDVRILACAYLSYCAVRVSIESLGFQPFGFSTLMISFALACAVWRGAPGTGETHRRRRTAPQIRRAPAAERPGSIVPPRRR